MSFDNDAFAKSLLGDRVTTDVDAEVEQNDAAELEQERSTESAQDDNVQVEADVDNNDTSGPGESAEQDGEQRPETNDGDTPERTSHEKGLINALAQQRRETAELKRQLEAMTAHLQAQQQQVQQPQPQPQPQQNLEFNPTTTYEDDPTKYLYEYTQFQQRQMQMMAHVIMQQHEQGQQAQQQAQMQQQHAAQTREFRNQVLRQENEFRSQAADYDDAVGFIRQRLQNEMEAGAEARGYSAKDPVVVEKIRNDIVGVFSNFAQDAMRNGQNAAEAVYRYAQRIGYTGAQNPNAADKAYARAVKGQAAARTSASINGSAPSAPRDDGAQTPTGFGDIAKQLQSNIYGRR